MRPESRSAPHAFRWRCISNRRRAIHTHRHTPTRKRDESGMGRDESGFLGRIGRAGWDESAARGAVTPRPRPSAATLPNLSGSPGFSFSEPRRPRPCCRRRRTCATPCLRRSNRIGSSSSCAHRRMPRGRIGADGPRVLRARELWRDFRARKIHHLAHTPLLREVQPCSIS